MPEDIFVGGVGDMKDRGGVCQAGMEEGLCGPYILPSLSLVLQAQPCFTSLLEAGCSRTDQPSALTASHSA